MSEQEFWHSTMRSLNSHIEAYKMIQKARDEEMWRMGMYMVYSVTVAVDHVLGGKKSKSEYLKKPMLEQLEEDNRPLTEKEIKRQRKELADNLRNFEKEFNKRKNKQ